MKRKKLEIAVLIIGALVIVASLLVKFIFDLEPDQTLMVSNIIFSLGFLIYILYSIMTTNNLNRTINRLEANIEGLKDEISKKNKQLEEKDKTIGSMEEQNKELEQSLSQAQAENKELDKKLKELREAHNEAK
ncbi:MAG: hypothetical protein U5L96_01585 [Owenweeksia sp.]|nr:hypothetical protein [Owenweeksia sp.]